MRYDIFRRLEDLISCTTVQSLTNTFERHMCYYGFDQYALAFPTSTQKEDDAPAVIATYDKIWVDHYFENGYDAIDPVFLTTRKQIQPFLWSDIWKGVELTARQQLLFDEAKDYGIAHGMGIPIRIVGRENALLSLVSTVCKPDEVQQIASEYMTEIALLTSYFHQVADTLMIQESEASAPSSRKILTEREAETLLWIARGKSDEDVGSILNISVHTVREHVRSIYKKMNVTSRSQACAMAVLDGIIKNVFSVCLMVTAMI
jgi:DNA-binding CsgD family transcriptional regulator